MSDIKKLFLIMGVFAMATVGVVLSAETDDEGQADKIAKIILDTLIAKQKANPGATVQRDAHAKHHGCVTAQFTVLDTVLDKLPASARAGVFKAPHTYPAWIRFSNGSGQSQNDSDGDGRGMAIKLMEVPNAKILDAEKDEQTQDFLMINHPVFFVRNPADYVEFTKATASGSIKDFIFPSWNPLTWRTHEALIGEEIKLTKVVNPLESPYWSETPYQLGEEQIKFSVTPCLSASGLYTATASPSFLRDNMKKELDVHGACYEFNVQIRTHKDPNDKTMPIEDPTINWDDAKNPAAPYVKVAVINIPKQDFLPNQDFCENLSYTPWHSLPEHRPLGGINLVRKTVYETVSKFRHEQNKADRKEPTGFSIH